MAFVVFEIHYFQPTIVLLSVFYNIRVDTVAFKKKIIRILLSLSHPFQDIILSAIVRTERFEFDFLFSFQASGVNSSIKANQL
jgi:hypothetical protein